MSLQLCHLVLLWRVMTSQILSYAYFDAKKPSKFSLKRTPIAKTPSMFVYCSDRQRDLSLLTEVLSLLTWGLCSKIST